MFKAVQKIKSTAGTTPRGPAAQDKEEQGTWHYLVLDPHGIRPRTDPSYGKDTAKEKSRYKEAEVVEVSRRRRSGWTTWLACGDGWVFDVSPKDKKVRMIEVEVSNGDWQYQVCGETMPVLQRPSPTLTTRARLQLDEVVAVREKVQPLSGGTAFIRLADGRGWVSEMAAGHQVMRRCGVEPATVAGATPAAEPGSPASSERTRSLASSSELAGGPELGEWSYVVLDPRGIALRRSATDGQGEKLGLRLAEGELVSVVERRVGNGTTFLRLDTTRGGGWAFDVAARKGAGDRRIRMMEVAPESGRWEYQVCSEKGIAVRSICSMSDCCKVGKGPQRGALAPVVERVKVGETTFLRLEEGGWIFDRRGGVLLVQGPLEIERLEETATLRQSKGVHLSSSPTSEKWSETKMLILHGATVRVDRLGLIDGLRWAHISKPGGSMEGWVLADTLTFEMSQATGTAALSQQQQFSAEQVRAAWFAADPTRPNLRTIEAC